MFHFIKIIKNYIIYKLIFLMNNIDYDRHQKINDRIDTINSMKSIKKIISGSSIDRNAASLFLSFIGTDWRRKSCRWYHSDVPGPEKISNWFNRKIAWVWKSPYCCVTEFSWVVPEYCGLSAHGHGLDIVLMDFDYRYGLIGLSWFQIGIPARQFGRERATHHEFSSSWDWLFFCALEKRQARRPMVNLTISFCTMPSTTHLRC